jgi:hypothetical protein
MLCDIYVNAHRRPLIEPRQLHMVSPGMRGGLCRPLLAAELRPWQGVAESEATAGRVAVVRKFPPSSPSWRKFAEGRSVIVGGASPTPYAAAGMKIGNAGEPDLVEEGNESWRRSGPGRLRPLPMDVVVVKEFSATASAATKDVPRSPMTT